MAIFTAKQLSICVFCKRGAIVFFLYSIGTRKFAQLFYMRTAQYMYSSTCFLLHLLGKYSCQFNRRLIVKNYLIKIHLPSHAPTVSTCIQGKHCSELATLHVDFRANLIRNHNCLRENFMCVLISNWTIRCCSK